jgi:hypothetical protein
LTDFRRSLAGRANDSLTTLLSADTRFRQVDTAPIAYAESWALVHFLLKRYPREFQEYMRLLAAKKPLLFDSPEERLADFHRCFRKGLAELDPEFLRYTTSIR